jgi:hypothetical protein
VAIGSALSAVEGVTAKMEERKLIYLGPGPHRDKIELVVDQVLQIRPFRFPLVPPFEEVEVKAELRGERALHFIGQAPSPSSKEGRASLDAFFYAVSPGECTIHLELTATKGKPIEGYGRTYSVVVKRGSGGNGV